MFGCWLKRGLATLAVAAAFVFATAAFGSEWDTRYFVAGTGTVNAHVVLNGSDGTYTLDDGVTTGTLSNITYSGDKVKVIRGKWALGGDTGTFKWTIPPSGGQFTGQWFGDVGGSGFWNGQRTDSDSGGPVKPGTFGPVWPRRP
jgi:hypothetical protein